MMKHVSRQEIALELSRYSEQPVMVIQYPNEDDKNHKSRDALVRWLHDSGFHHAAEAIDNNAVFLRGNDPKEALKVYHQIEEHSAAISADLYYKGYVNDDIKKVLK